MLNYYSEDGFKTVASVIIFVEKTMEEIIEAARTLSKIASGELAVKRLPTSVGRYKVGATGVGSKVALSIQGHPHVESLEVKKNEAGVVVTAVMKKLLIPRSSVGEEVTTIARLVEGVNSDKEVDKVIAGEKREAITSKVEAYLSHTENGQIDIEHATSPGAGFKVTLQGPNIAISAIKPGEFIRLTPATQEALGDLLKLHERASRSRRYAALA